jgi:hypothetical protein
MYPLTEDYEARILEFIEKLKAIPGIKIETNSTSTRLSGPMDLLARGLSEACVESWSLGQNVFCMKWLRGDLLA